MLVYGFWMPVHFQDNKQVPRKITNSFRMHQSQKNRCEPYMKFVKQKENTDFSPNFYYALERFKFHSFFPSIIKEQ